MIKNFDHVTITVSDLEPLDATGGVRIAFFRDPDGVLLEIVEGDLELKPYNPAN